MGSHDLAGNVNNTGDWTQWTLVMVLGDSTHQGVGSRVAFGGAGTTAFPSYFLLWSAMLFGALE